MQKVLLSNFPGSEVTAVSQKEEDKLLNDPAEGAFGEYQEAVASVSCVAETIVATTGMSMCDLMSRRISAETGALSTTP